MNESDYNDEDHQLIREIAKEKNIYFESYEYQDQIREFNQRNPTYGVTVDFRFLKTIQQCDFLENSQLQFFINVFRKAYSEVKLAAATCHFFADFIVSLQIPPSQQQQNQTNQTDNQSQKVQQQNKNQSHNKIRDDLIDSNVMKKNIFSEQSNINDFQSKSNTSIITENSRLPNDSIISVQQQPADSADKFKNQYAQSQIISKTTYDDKVNQPYQSVIQKNNIANNQSQSQLLQRGRDVQVSKQSQVIQAENQQSQINIGNQKNQSDSNISDAKSIPVQAPLNVQQNSSNLNDQILIADESQILSNQFINSNVGSLNVNKQQTNQEQFKNTQSIIINPQNNQQAPFAQAQVEQQQVQPPPEKKYHFQITNMTIQKPAQQENINKSYLPQLIKQLAEVNCLTEEQLKEQDYWYFPINQLQSHWISVVIDFRKKEIWYFDSYYKKTDPVIMQGINSILEYFKINPSSFQTKPVYIQQINGYDCGVFILLSLLYTLQQKTYNYNQSIATKFRKRVLYNLAVIGAQSDISSDILEIIIEQS
ncbi:unnamed protein product [Paramecium octaurelia]|uniref:Ubiquitin-like protease family profile domain-containing protein n=1 Tax=Paramecium octaurelia TaxID=43137 RepID=A0A8S1SSA5_PAROT|nr:unnamed protein product [Paramecium octaurelia]